MIVLDHDTLRVRSTSEASLTETRFHCSDKNKGRLILTAQILGCYNVERMVVYPYATWFHLVESPDSQSPDSQVSDSQFPVSGFPDSKEFQDRISEMQADIKECRGIEIEKSEWPVAKALMERYPGRYSLSPARGPGNNWRRIVENS